MCTWPLEAEVTQNKKYCAGISRPAGSDSRARLFHTHTRPSRSGFDVCLVRLRRASLEPLRGSQHEMSDFALCLDEQRLAFRRNRDRRNGVVIPLDVAM